MRWRNKGKEFENIGRRIGKYKKIFIYGAGEYGEILLEKLELVNERVLFIDRSLEKQKIGYKGKKVISPEKLTIEFLEGAMVIVAASMANTPVIMKNLMKLGMVEGENLFSYRNFVELYLPIYLYYAEKKIYFQDITILITEKCTLRCKDCAPMYPYLEKRSHRSFEDIKRDIDMLFEKVDFVWNLIFTGGEPFLHPELYGILDYLNRNYREKYGHIQIISNGTVIPKKELLEFMAKLKLYISISDYTPYVEKEVYKNFEKFIRSLEQYQVAYEINRTEHWVDFGFRRKINERTVGRKEEELISFFDDCNSSCRAFHRRRFVYCVPAFYADITINQKQEKDMDCDNFYSPETEAELVEWGMGFCKKGYLEMCKYCDGYITINNKFVTPAEQLKKESSNEY